MEIEKEVEKIEEEIAFYKTKIEKEKQNLRDSGFEEGESELFAEIEDAYWIDDIIPLLLKRHKLKPYTKDEQVEFHDLLLYLGIEIDDPMHESLEKLKERKTR